MRVVKLCAITYVVDRRYRETKNRFSDLKDKLLKLLLVQSQTHLTASGCPLDEAIILQMMKVGQTCPDLPEDLYKKFEQWWIMQSSTVVPKIQPSVLPQSVRDMFYRNGSSPRQSNIQDSPANCIVPKADPKTHSLQVISFVKYIVFTALRISLQRNCMLITI